MKRSFEGGLPAASEFSYGFEGWSHLPPGDVLFDEQTIWEREVELVSELIHDYDFADPDVVCCCVLKGGLPFFLDAMSIIRQATGIEPRQAYIKTETYTASREASKTIITYESLPDVAGLTVLAFEDMCDKNGTYACLHNRFSGVGQAASFELIPLFVKDVSNKEFPDPLRYGFRAPDRWSGGMGLDLGDKTDPDAGRAFRSVFAIDG